MKLQFRLRTLLIVVTLLAVPCWWVAKQKLLVNDRQAMLNQIEKVYHGRWYVEQLPPERPSSVSGLRRLLGDQAVGTISLPIEADAAIFPPIHSLFPEGDPHFF